MSVSITLLRPLSLELTRRGIEPWPILAEIGVNPTRLSVAQDVISMRAFDTWLGKAVALCGDSAFGLSAGVQAPLLSLIGIGPLLQSCTNLREALDMLQRYAQAFALCLQCTVTEDGARAIVICRLDRPPGPLRVQLEDFVVGLVYNVLCAFLTRGDLRMAEVHLTHAAPRHVDTYSALLSCTTRFCAPTSGVGFSRKLLDEPNPHADPLTRAVFVDHLENVLRLRKGRNCEESVRFAIRQGPVGDQMDVRAVADAVGLSIRTLRRKLRGDGTNASTLINDERARIACRELARHDMTIKEVSLELGYSEPSAFYRAFKRWSGVTPSQFKRSLGPRKQLGV